MAMGCIFGLSFLPLATHLSTISPENIIFFIMFKSSRPPFSLLKLLENRFYCPYSIELYWQTLPQSLNNALAFQFVPIYH